MHAVPGTPFLHNDIPPYFHVRVASHNVTHLHYSQHSLVSLPTPNASHISDLHYTVCSNVKHSVSVMPEPQYRILLWN